MTGANESIGVIEFPIIKQHIGQREVFDDDNQRTMMETWWYSIRVGNEMLEFYHQEPAELFNMLPDDLKQGALMDSMAYDVLKLELLQSVAKYNNIQFFPQEYLQTYRWQDLFKAAFKKLFTKKEPIDE
jgi:hypothetical protein